MAIFIFFAALRTSFALFAIMATVLTLALSFLFGILVAYFDSSVLFYSVLIMAIVWVSQTLFAYQTKFKYTALRGFLVTLVVVILSTLVFGLIIGWIKLSISGAIALAIAYAINFYLLKLIEKETVLVD